MGVTSIRKIFFQTLGTKYNPVSESRTQADSIEETLKYTPVFVDSAAHRDQTFPTPYQGASVYRRDTGDTERYFDAFNAQTNPGGRSPAGWYSENVKVRTAFFTQVGQAATNGAIVYYRKAVPVAAQTINNDFCTPLDNGYFDIRAGLYAITQTWLSQGSSMANRSFMEFANGEELSDASLIARASIPRDEDRSSLSLTYFVPQRLILAPRFYKNAVSAVVPTTTMSITKIG